MHAPVMASANSLWDARSGKFSPSWRKLGGLDVHLDSGGFTSMKCHGGYRFTIEEYMDLAAEMEPTWYAAMDYCCEPEIIGASEPGDDEKHAARLRHDAAKGVSSDYSPAARDRIVKTLDNLDDMITEARVRRMPAPMPVINGWKPEDYLWCAGLFDRYLFAYSGRGEWPALVGLGSFCRRNVHGPEGIIEIMEKLAAVLPEHVRFHLFGVKGAAAIALRGHPRVASIDSMAWSARARVVAREAGKPCDNELRADFMAHWLVRHREAIRPRHEETTFSFLKETV